MPQKLGHSLASFQSLPANPVLEKMLVLKIKNRQIYGLLNERRPKLFVSDTAMVPHEFVYGFNIMNARIALGGLLKDLKGAIVSIVVPKLSS